MALGDITVLEQTSLTGRGGRLYNVAAGTAIIYPGEPVARALGAVVVTACATNAGQVGTDYIVGVALTQSTQTASVAGSLEVLPVSAATTYLITAKTASSWNTQAKYDALVGKRVLIDLTSGSYTLLATDGSGNACVVMPLDISKYPGKVAIAFRQAVSDLA